MLLEEAVKGRIRDGWMDGWRKRVATRRVLIDTRRDGSWLFRVTWDIFITGSVNWDR